MILFNLVENFMKISFIKSFRTGNMQTSFYTPSLFLNPPFCFYCLSVFGRICLFVMYFGRESN